MLFPSKHIPLLGAMSYSSNLTSQGFKSETFTFFVFGIIVNLLIIILLTSK